MATAYVISDQTIFQNWDPYYGVESQVCNLVYGHPDTTEEKDDELKKND